MSGQSRTTARPFDPAVQNGKVATESAIEGAQNLIKPLLARFEQFVIGQAQLGERILTALLAQSHLLEEGVPGTAKTFRALVMSRLLNISFSRIQLTPDLLPADITGQEIFRPQTGEFEIREGPVFANLVLADEINRASPKTQAALLEAMQEKQVTIAGETKSLTPPFMVIATQNPLEHEGTYPLPEAQLDRFLFKLIVENATEIEHLLRIDDVPDIEAAESMLTAEQVVELQTLVTQVSVSESVRRYRAELVLASRNRPALEAGASDRRSKLLLNAAKARALIHGRSYVTVDDVRELVPDAFRHVLFLRPEAYVEKVSIETVIGEILAEVPAPEEK